MRIYESRDQLVGHTPLLKLNQIKKELNLKGNVLVKLEMMNPAGSIKDRAALHMLNMAENKGLVHEGTVVIEPTSGNTGIGLASACAVRGYRCVILMPDTMSVE